MLFQASMPAQAQYLHIPEPEPGRIMAVNMALTGLFATTRGLINGTVDTPLDAAQTFAAGAVGGYGFYQAKRLVGKGHEIGGLALAYTSSSVVENVSRGHHPLGFVRFGPGPADLRLRTPFARQEEAPWVTVEVNAVSVLNLILLPLLGYEPSFYQGTLFYFNETYLGRRGYYRRDGFALNRSVILAEQAGPETAQHELVHVIQSLQAGAVTPYYRFSTILPGVNRTIGTDKLMWDVQFDWLYSLLALSSLTVPYDERWVEIEAYTLE